MIQNYFLNMSILNCVMLFIIIIGGNADDTLTCEEHFLCSQDFCDSTCAPKVCIHTPVRKFCNIKKNDKPWFPKIQNSFS